MSLGAQSWQCWGSLSPPGDSGWRRAPRAEDEGQGPCRGISPPDPPGPLWERRLASLAQRQQGNCFRGRQGAGFGLDLRTDMLTGAGQASSSAGAELPALMGRG